MKKNEIVDVKFTELNNSSTKKYHTVEEVGEIISIDVPKIIFWCNKFSEILNVQIIGMYPIFNKHDIKNLKVIKDLTIDRGMSVNQAKEYLNKHKDIIILKNKIEVPEVSLLTVIAKILTSQDEKITSLAKSYENLVKLNQNLINNQNNFKNSMLDFQNEVCLGIENQSNKTCETQNQHNVEILTLEQKHMDEINVLKDEILKLNETITNKMDSIEQGVSKKLNDQEILLKQNNKSFWNRLFNK